MIVNQALRAFAAYIKKGAAIEDAKALETKVEQAEAQVQRGTGPWKGA